MPDGGLRPNLPGSDQQAVNAAMLMATRTNPVIAVFILFFSFCVGIFSFIVKPILRKNLGERTFGVLTILLCFLVLRGFYVYDLYGRIPNDVSKYVPGWYFRTDLVGINPGELYLEGNGLFDAKKKVQDWKQHFPKFPSPVGLYGYIVLAFGIAEFYNVWNRRKQKLRMHSQYRGESRFFSSLKGKKILGTTIDDAIIRAFLEPFLVVILGLLLLIFGDKYFGLALLLGAGTLLLEEYLFYIKRRQMLLDMIDNEIDGEYIMLVKEQYQRSPESFRTKEAFAQDPTISKATMD